MDTEIYKKIVEKLTIPYGYGRIVKDTFKKPIGMEFLELNDEFIKITGLKADVLMEHTDPIFSFEKNELLSRESEFIEELFLKIRIHKKDFKYNRENNKLTYQLNINYLENDHFVLSIKNITDEINLMVRLNENEQNFNRFFEMGLDLFCVVDLNGMLILNNMAWKKVLGYEMNELKGANIKDFICSEDYYKTLEMMRLISQRKKEIQHFLNRFYHRSGKKRWIEWSARRYGDYIYCSGRDITERLEMEEEFAIQNERFELALNGSNDGIWDWNIEEDELFFSTRFKEQLGYRPEELNSEFSTVKELIYEEDQMIFNEYITGYLNGVYQNFDLEFRMHHKQGKLVWIRSRGVGLQNEEGKFIRMAGSHTDITIRKKNEQRLKKREEQYRLIAENMSDVIWVYNLPKDQITFISPSAKAILGYEPESLLGQSLKDRFTEENYRELNTFIEKSREKFLIDSDSRDTYALELQQRHANGQLFWMEYTIKFSYNHQGELEIYGTTSNIEERKKVEHLSYRDHLTGLYNRHFFESVIYQEIEQADRYHDDLSLLLLDLDLFKRVNDTYGHPVGDDVLKYIAEVAGSMVRKADILVRFGGEEFLILMSHTNLKGAMRAGEKIRQKIESGLHPVVGKLTVSIGVAQRIEYETFLHWYNRVDEALYQAKKNGRNCVKASENTIEKKLLLLRNEWQEDWECKNPFIDEQHKKLNDLSNRLIEKIIMNEEAAKIENSLELFIKFMKKHFRDEERILLLRKYPYLREHRQMHYKLIEKANRLKEAYRKGAVSDSIFFSYIVDDVLIGHLEKEDTKYYPYVKMN